ncbi:MAG: hypothetical protein H0X41_14195, partial [Chitinophagaceae bacterium]|nr:hypothetical protein [Chitinophagaceae bacterium]
HKSVSIPGLGTIYVERIPAQSDFINRQLLPPAYHYRFDKYFDAPEKEFFSFIATRENIPEYEAIKLYNEWALGIRNGISADQAKVLEGIGSLKRDSSGDIVFEPLSALKTYDIAVPAERIIRSNARHAMIVGDKETTTVEMTDYLHEVHKEKTSWWIYALIVAAIAVVAIFFHYFRNGSDAPFGNHQTIETR